MSLRRTDHVPPSHLPDTEWGRDFQPTVPIFYEMSANLGVRGRPIAGIALHRKKKDRDFSGRDMAIVNTVLPHLARAVQDFERADSRALWHDQIRARLVGLGLTRREQEVAALAIGGSSNREIAARRFISELTVKDHLKNVFGKLEVRRRSELALRILGGAARNSRPPSAPA